ncbi:transcriptional regulator [Longilinea arvoryzae]|uniref:Transcriptional regulator n=1 Tax=Longilinea arvoryzae TaxID=360412 RepID=A0A0S7BJM8_9CHLR|nr:GntR family transcriptional regulator [Longilinea arvoryzae]GAP14520.1 transcriptional regulator [Longilinea arvoryzae]
MINLNRDTVVPLYHQLSEILKELIQSGQIPAGTKLPSERELMDRYHLSRNTVRQAIDLLVHDGFVYQDHGKGNYSIGPFLNIQYRIDTFVEHSEFLRRVGSTPTYKNFGTDEIVAPEEVRKALRLGENELVVCFTKLFFANNEPAILTLDYLPRKLLGDNYDRTGSGDAYIRLLEEINGRMVKFTLSDIVAMNATQEIAEYLNLTPGSSILLFQETFLDPSKNVPLGFASNYYHPNIHFRILRHRLNP